MSSMSIRTTACKNYPLEPVPTSPRAGLDSAAAFRPEALASSHSENTPSGPKNSNLLDEVILSLPRKSAIGKLTGIRLRQVFTEDIVSDPWCVRSSSEDRLASRRVGSR
jgi:hypothetical protein